MVKNNIVFKDLQEDVQEEVWVLVSKRLLDDGWVQRETEESDADFQDRLWEVTHEFINTHPVTFAFSCNALARRRAPRPWLPFSLRLRRTSGAVEPLN
jgi:hypothetical protein